MVWVLQCRQSKIIFKKRALCAVLKICFLWDKANFIKDKNNKNKF